MKKFLSILLALIVVAMPLTIAASAITAEEVIEYPSINEKVYTPILPATNGGMRASYDINDVIVAILKKVQTFFNDIMNAFINLFMPEVTPPEEIPIEPIDETIECVFYAGNVTINDIQYGAEYALTTDRKAIILREINNNEILYMFYLPSNWEYNPTYIEYISPEIIVIKSEEERVYINTQDPLNDSDPMFVASKMVFEYNNNLWDGSIQQINEYETAEIKEILFAEETETVLVITSIADGAVYGFRLRPDNYGNYYMP